jgi:hypothetical protein
MDSTAKQRRKVTPTVALQREAEFRQKNPKVKKIPDFTQPPPIVFRKKRGSLKTKHLDINAKYIAGHKAVSFNIIRDGVFYKIIPFRGGSIAKELRGHFATEKDAEKRLIQWIKRNDYANRGIYPGGPASVEQDLSDVCKRTCDRKRSSNVP